MPIANQIEYEDALDTMDALIGVEPGTPEADELARLADEVAAWEAEHCPIGIQQLTGWVTHGSQRSSDVAATAG